MTGNVIELYGYGITVSEDIRKLWSFQRRENTLDNYFLLSLNDGLSHVSRKEKRLSIRCVFEKKLVEA